MRRLAIALLLTTATACAKQDSDPGPGGVTVGEAKALDDAARELEQRPQPHVTVTAPAAQQPDGKRG
jgi:hypothetical protein